MAERRVLKNAELHFSIHACEITDSLTYDE